MRVRFVRLLQKNINISLRKREVGCHTKRTTTMAEGYSNNAIVFEGATCINTHGVQL